MEKKKFSFTALLLLTLGLAIIYFLLNFLSVGNKPIDKITGSTPVVSLPPTPVDPVASMISNIKLGSGETALKGMKVSVHYTGKLKNGTTFDSSVGKAPISFVLGKGKVIKGWDLGLLGMKVGGKRTLTIPPELAYGKSGISGVIPANATLIFTIELVSVSNSGKVVHEVPGNGVIDLSNIQLKKMLDKGAILIDIRRKEEWKETGVVAGSHLITLYNSDQTIHKDFNDKFSSLIQDTTTPFIIICRTGSRTAFASNIMVNSMGLTNVYNVKLGITHWIAKGNPVNKIN